MPSLSAIGASVALVVAIASGTVAVEGRYATKTEVSGNTVLILFTQLDRANREVRRLREQDKRIPQSLLDEIMRLCRDIREHNRKC